MRKTLILLLMLVSAVCLLAQDNMGKSSGTTTTIQGCLSKDGYYFLTDSSGKKYHLVGYNGKEINHHVGHTVEITGMPTIKTTDTTVQGAESTAKETPVFKVKSVKHISDTCTQM
jgi:hypothetical protein